MGRCGVLARSEPVALMLAKETMRGRLLRLTAMLSIIAVASSCGGGGINSPAASISEFEQRLEALRATSHITGITAAIAKDQQIVWAKGFGIADIATQRPAADTTTYHLASLTKPFASTVLLQLVDEGKVSLDDPVSMYGISIPSAGVIRVRHLLSMTSEGDPGSKYLYNGDRYALLESVIARAAGKSFAAALDERILTPIGLNRTAPNPQSPSFAVTGLDRATFESNMALGYSYVNRAYAATSYPSLFSPAAGLTSSALDVATFSMAMDRDAFLRPATKALAYTPVTSQTSEVFPYGLGWFSTVYSGVRVIWHYGLWTANSSIIIKVPDRGLTFVVLANTDGLSSPYPLASGRLDSSPWAREFLDTFVIGSLALPAKR